MKNTILLNNLWKEVSKGRVSASQTGSYTLFKYTQETHIKDLWNDVNRQARGIIFDVDGTIVARPFPKFFNMNERPETSPKNLPWHTEVEVFEKMDGSCGIGYFGTGGPEDELPVYLGSVPMWRLATPGSMESDQAIMGTRILNGSVPECEGPPTHPHSVAQETVSCLPRYNLGHLPTDCTPVFEIIYPDNRIVVDYEGKTFLSLLAIFEHSGEEWHPRRVDQIAGLCGFHRPKRYKIDLQSDIPFEDNTEGYVCRFGDGTRVKVKSPRYLQLHRLLDRCSAKGVIELMRGREYRVTLAMMPREMVLRFDDIRAHVQGIYNEINTEVCGHYRTMTDSLGPLAARKDCAVWIQTNVPKELTGFVFGMMDEKDIDDSLWRMVLEKVKADVRMDPQTI